jgi:hypothetical protein
MLPVLDIPVDPLAIPAPPLMPEALDDFAPGIPPMPDDAPWDPEIPAMPDIPDWTPNPATPRGRVAGMLEIPPPPIKPAFGRVSGVIVPLLDGLADRGDPVGRSPITVIPPCCAHAGAATTVRAKLTRRLLDQYCHCCIGASPYLPAGLVTAMCSLMLSYAALESTFFVTNSSARA